MQSFKLTVFRVQRCEVGSVIIPNQLCVGEKPARCECHCVVEHDAQTIIVTMVPDSLIVQRVDTFVHERCNGSILHGKCLRRSEKVNISSFWKSSLH